MPEINFTDKEVKALGEFCLMCIEEHFAHLQFQADFPEMMEDFKSAAHKFAESEMEAQNA